MAMPALMFKALVFAVVGLLLVPTLGCAQQAASPSPSSKGLRLFVLEGEGATNSIKGDAVGPVVELRDANDSPVEGAEITFRTPAAGASAYLGGQQLVFTTKTNAQGQAGVKDYRANQVPGKFKVVVTARYGDLSDSIAVNQINGVGEVRRTTSVRSGRRSHKLMWILVAAAVAGAGAGTYLAVRKKDTAPVGITVGPPVFGTPR